MDDESAGMNASPNQQKGKAQEEARKIIQQIPNDKLIELIADRLQELPGEETKEIIQTVVRAQLFSGPIPPPEMLAQYASVNSDIPDRIITMAETQQQHRQTLERQLLEAETKEGHRGQLYALILSVLLIGSTLFSIVSGNPIYGTIFAGSTLIGLAYVFISGRKKKPPTEPD